VLPDGTFSNQKSKFGYILEGLVMEDVGIFMAILSILRLHGIFYGHLVNFVVIWYIFPRFGMLYREKSGNPVVYLSSASYLTPLIANLFFEM
jgi:hypothetical protein